MVYHFAVSISNYICCLHKLSINSDTSVIPFNTCADEMQTNDSNNSAGEKVDGEKGTVCIFINHYIHIKVSIKHYLPFYLVGVHLPLQEDKDSALGKSEATESVSLENYRTDTQEVIKEQLDDNEGGGKETSNPPLSDNRSKSSVLESNELNHTGDEVVTGGVSSLAPDMVFDCSDVSPVFDFSSSGK